MKDALVDRRENVASPTIRGRALVLVFGIACALVGGSCTGTRAPVGLSDGPPRGGANAANDAGSAARRATGLPTNFRASYTKVNRARFVSQGHNAGRYEVDVYASPAASDAATAASGEIPTGARLIEEHFQRSPAADGPSHAGPLMMMEKMDKGFDPDHGDWRYVVVNSAGELVQDGKIESCAGCHDDAPHDHLFHVE